MAAAHAPDPDDSVTLSPREKRLLASIEDELWSSDPEFGLHMTTGGATGREWSWTADSYGAAAAGVLLFLVVAAVLPPSWRAVLGLVLTLGVLPWLLLRAIGRNTRE
jgi:hypothetical protein